MGGEGAVRGAVLRGDRRTKGGSTAGEGASRLAWSHRRDEEEDGGAGQWKWKWGECEMARR